VRVALAGRSDEGRGGEATDTIETPGVKNAKVDHDYEIRDGIIDQEKSYYLREEYSMLQKYTITSCAFILCLFASTITPAETEWAHRLIIDTAHRISLCDDMKGNSQAGNKLNCFKTLVLDLEAQKLEATTQHEERLSIVDRRQNTETEQALKMLIRDHNEMQRAFTLMEDGCSKEGNHTHIRSAKVEEMMKP
jgi:hypothetical protein